MILFLFLCMVIQNSFCNIQIKNLEISLDRILNFIDFRIGQFGFDGILGVVLAQAQLMKILNFSIPYKLKTDVNYLISKCQIIVIKGKTLLPKYPPYMLRWQDKLLNPKNWMKTLPNKPISGKITDLGIYQNWTTSKILNDKQARYKGMGTDLCLFELLDLTENKTCHVSEFCQEMMLNISRVDTGYLLTHRLLYLQIKRIQNCDFSKKLTKANNYTRLFCSYIYKEAKTSEYLMYPYHDIFLEQVVLCGMEGFSEFLSEKWLIQILNWQHPHGCYESVSRNIVKRTSRIVEYGCSDHTTGLGAAAIAIHINNLLYKT